MKNLRRLSDFTEYPLSYGTDLLLWLLSSIYITNNKVNYWLFSREKYLTDGCMELHGQFVEWF